MHIADFLIGVVGTIGIVGAGIPITNGVDLAAKMKKTKRVVVSFFGDGAYRYCQNSINRRKK